MTFCIATLPWTGGTTVGCALGILFCEGCKGAVHILLCGAGVIGFTVGKLDLDIIRLG